MLLSRLLYCPLLVCRAANEYCRGSSEIFENGSSVSSLAHTTRFDELPVDVYFYIGEFLNWPRIQLGSLNRHLRGIATQKFPYSRLLAKLHGIVELESSTSDLDLSVFSQLAFLKDKNRDHLDQLLFALLFRRKSFTDNKYLILKYLVRTSGIRGTLPHLDSEIARIMKNYSGYRTMKKYPIIELLIEYSVKSNSFLWHFCRVIDMKVVKEFMVRVMNINVNLAMN